MKKLFLLLSLVLLAACNKDDQADIEVVPEKLKTAAPMEVAIVFEPLQIGSMCTNDFLLKDVEDLTNAYPDTLASTFICRMNYQETHQAIKTWASLAYGAEKRQHRLLILTDPALADAMEGVQLQETDHLLMLKTRLDDARQVGPEGRTHVLNVSLANSVRQAVAYRYQQCMEQYADTITSDTKIEYDITIWRLNEDVSYGDSIVETLQELFPEKKVGSSLSVEWNDIKLGGMKLKNYKNVDYSDLMYLMAFFSLAMQDPLTRIKRDILTIPLLFCDLGTFNRSYEWFWLTHRDSPYSSLDVLVGECANNDEPIDYIVPKYELKSWLTRWLNSPDDMPEEEWSRTAVFSPWRERY